MTSPPQSSNKPGESCPLSSISETNNTPTTTTTLSSSVSDSNTSSSTTPLSTSPFESKDMMNIHSNKLENTEGYSTSMSHPVVPRRLASNGVMMTRTAVIPQRKDSL